jgi:hypothetical protein
MEQVYEKKTLLFFVGLALLHILFNNVPIFPLMSITVAALADK